MSGFWGKFGKRGFDLIISAVILFFLWPVLLLIALLVRINLGSPILFTQARLGIHTKEFRLYKFRSMTNERSSNGELLADSKRLTRFGKFLRSTSLDELPQVLNVIKGEMSFIGPRATLPAYKKLLLERYPKRFKVLPGITSLPAVRGRNALSWDERFSLDIEYVEKFGACLDFYIFFHTIPVVLGRKGISMAGVETATRYDEEEREKETQSDNSSRNSL